MKVPQTYRIGRRPLNLPAAESTSVVPQKSPVPGAVEDFGRTLMSGGAQALKIGNEIEDQAARDAEILAGKVNRAKAQEADAKLADGFREIMFSPKGYSSLLGRAAVDGREGAIKALDEHRKRILDTLTPEQRDLVFDSDNRRYQHARSQIDGHYGQQTEAYDIAETEARANSLMLDASNAWFAPTSQTYVEPEDPASDSPQEPTPPPATPKKPPQAFTDNRNAMRTSLAQLAVMQGLGPRAAASLLQKADDNLFGSIIDRLVEDGRALEAADLLEAQGARASVGSRSRVATGLRASAAAQAKAQKDVQEAGYEEQAQAIAVQLGQSGRDVSEQLGALDQLHAEGKIPLEVRDRADKRVVHAETQRQNDLVRAGTQTFTAAQAWQTANSQRVLPENVRLQLRATGKEAAFDLWMLQGGHLVTTDQARLEELAMDDVELANAFETAEPLIASFHARMSPKDLESLVLRWRKARGESLHPKDAMKIEGSLQQRNYLREKGFYTNWTSGAGSGNEPTALAVREDRFTEAVQLRYNQLAAGRGGGDQSAVYRQAIEDVWGDGFVVDDKYIPSVMATPEEKLRAKSQPTKSGKVYEFTKDMPGHNVSSFAYLVDGTRIDLRPREDADYVMQAEEMRADFKRLYGREPTWQELADQHDKNEEERKQRTKDAEEVASVLNKTRAEELLQRLPGEFDREFNRQYKTMLDAQVAEAKTARGGYRADRGIISNVPSPGELERERQEAAKARPSRQPGTARPGDLTKTQEIYQAAVRTVLERHNSEITGYGLRNSDIVNSVIPDTRLPGDAPVRFGLVTSGANLPGVKLNLALTDAEQEFLTEMRRRYKKTELVEPKK